MERRCVVVFQPVSAQQRRRAVEFQGVALGIFATRIRDFRVSPPRVAVGDEVSISGGLQEHYEPIICLWRGWGPNPVKLVVDTTVVETRDTGTDGSFRFRWYPRETGTYWLRVRYDGDWAHNPCESPEVPVEVITKEQKEEEARRIWMFLVGTAAVAVVAVGGVVWWAEESRRRELMMAKLRG